MTSGIGGLLGQLGIGGAIGAAIVRLDLDVSNYERDLARQRASTTAAANSMGSSFTTFGSLAKAGLGAAGIAAVAFGVGAVKSAVDAQAAHVKLVNTFENNAKRLSDSSVESFEAIAEGLQKVTGVSDEAISDAMAVLGQFNLTGQQIEKIIPRVVDLSAKLNIDLVAAAKAVGKATEGNTAGLQRYGIVIDEVEGKGGEFASTLEGLGTVAGFAAERAEAEPWRLLASTFDELLEKAGQELVPALADVAEGIGGLIPVLEPVLVLLGDFLELAGDVAKALTLQESGFADHVAQAKALFEAYDSGEISITELEDALIALREETGFQTEVTEEYRDRLAAVRAEGERWTAQAAAMAGQERDAADATQSHTEALREQADQYLALTDPVFAVINAVNQDAEAEARLEAARRRLDQLTERGKQGTREYRDALAELDAATLDAAQSHGGMVSAVRELQEELRSGTNQDIRDAERALRGMGQQAGLSREEIDALVEKIRTGMQDASEYAREGGREVGRQLMAGLISGVNSMEEQLYQEAYEAAARAARAAEQALEEDSPSRRGRRIGANFIIGIIEGLESEEEALARQSQRQMDALIRQVEKQVAEIQGRLDRVLGRAGTLRSAISGGFSSFLDISGAFGTEDETGNVVVPDLQDFFSNQVAGAQQFASILRALQSRGISAGLLGQIASAGPQAIPFAQRLLQSGTEGIAGVETALATIRELAGTSRGGITESFFGEKIDELREQLRALERVERLLERPARLEVVFRGASTGPLEQFILDVLSRSNLARTSL